MKKNVLILAFLLTLAIIMSGTMLTFADGTAESVSIEDLTPYGCTVSLDGDLLSIKSISVTYAPIFLDSGVTEFTFTQKQCYWYILGGNSTLWTAICLNSQTHIGMVIDISQSAFTTKRDAQSNLTCANEGDKIRIRAIDSNTYNFYIQRAGDTSFSSWFALTKSAAPNATGWASNSRLGIMPNNGVLLNTIFTQGMFQIGSLATSSSGPSPSPSPTLSTSPPNQSIAESFWDDCTWDVIGDSITANGTYIGKVAETLGIAVSNNYGIGGTTIASQGTQTCMCVRYHDIDHTAQLITVFGGTNDCDANIPIGKITDITSRTFYGALNIMLTGLLEDNPTARIAMFTPMQRKYCYAPNAIDQYTNAIGLSVDDYAKAIVKACRKYSIPVLDLYAESGLCPKTFDTFTIDGIHPNQLGYDRISRLIIGFLNRI
jgi:lysophospholipase L1-like esterase